MPSIRGVPRGGYARVRGHHTSMKPYPGMKRFSHCVPLPGFVVKGDNAVGRRASGGCGRAITVWYRVQYTVTFPIGGHINVLHDY